MKVSFFMFGLDPISAKRFQVKNSKISWSNKGRNELNVSLLRVLLLGDHTHLNI